MIGFLWVCLPLVLLFSFTAVTYTAYVSVRVLKERRQARTVDQLLAHRDILADLDREFPAALALPVRTGDVPPPCSSCATVGLAGFCNCAPKASISPVARRSSLPPHVVQIDYSKGTYLLVNGNTVSKEQYHWAQLRYEMRR